MEPSLNVSGATQCERLCAATTVTSSANAVHVFLGQQGNVIVDDAASSRHMQSARCNIGRHHYICMTSGECSKRLGPLSLTAIAMDQNSFDCVTTQR